VVYELEFELSLLVLGRDVPLVLRRGRAFRAQALWTFEQRLRDFPLVVEPVTSGIRV
jgi:hypothetical protein